MSFIPFRMATSTLNHRPPHPPSKAILTEKSKSKKLKTSPPDGTDPRHEIRPLDRHAIRLPPYTLPSRHAALTANAFQLPNRQYTTDHQPNKGVTESLHVPRDPHHYEYTNQSLVVVEGRNTTITLSMHKTTSRIPTLLNQLRYPNFPES